MTWLPAVVVDGNKETDVYPYNPVSIQLRIETSGHPEKGDTLYLGQDKSSAWYSLDQAIKIRDAITSIIDNKLHDMGKADPLPMGTIILRDAHVKIPQSAVDLLTKIYDGHIDPQTDEDYSERDVDINTFLPDGVVSTTNDWEIR